MLSVILYGRNDSYGYNLHKRAALSLNCIAEVLTDPADEILFVDYNTPDDFPTFLEAIQDTLTPKARRLLRILRVRPVHHAAFAAKSHLIALEPVARNVAVRRSNPANRWVLSTNTDMIFVPRGPRSLSEMVAAAEDGFYCLPRFEVPEALWEGLDRMDAPGTIRRIAEWGERFHLNEIISHNMPALRFDAPGDFQLALRDDLFRIDAFDERMLLGYHVDSNLAQRLMLFGRKTADFLPELYGYHCDHMRQVTPAHPPGAVENDSVRFVYDIAEAGIAEQAASWGLAGTEIEETSLDAAGPSYADALAAAIPQPMDAPTMVQLGPETYDQIGYEVAHVLPFLLDSLASYPRDMRLGWFGCRADLLNGFMAAWRALGFTSKVMVAKGAPVPPEGAAAMPADAVAREANVLVFDFGLVPASPLQPALAQVVAQFRSAVRAEQARVKAGLTKRRFIAVNAIHNRFDGLVRNDIGVAKSPMATRIRQGFLLRAPGAPVDVLPLVCVEAAGLREAGGIRLLRNKRGYVFGGPQLDLLPGRYRVVLRWEPDQAGPWHPGPLKIAAIAGGEMLAKRYLVVNGLVAQTITLDFSVPEVLIARKTIALVDLLLTTIGYVGGRITKAELLTL